MPVTRRPPAHRISVARLLAPIALLLAVVAVGYLVNRTMFASSESSKPAATKKDKPKLKLPKQRYYVVKPGDVLSRIARKYDMSVERLQRLNPKLDASSLQPGQRVRLRRQ